MDKSVLLKDISVRYRGVEVGKADVRIDGMITNVRLENDYWIRMGDKEYVLNYSIQDKDE